MKKVSWQREYRVGSAETYIGRLPGQSKYDVWTLSVVRRAMGIEMELSSPGFEDTWTGSVFPVPKKRRQQNQVIFAWARSKMFNPLRLLAELGDDLA